MITPPGEKYGLAGLQPTLHIASDLQALARLGARSIAEQASKRVREQGRFTLALSGGRTPKVLFELLAGEFRKQIPWTRVHFFWGDERHVPHHHAESNYLMAQQTLLTPLSVTRQQIHPMRTDLSAEDCAEDYERRLKQFFGTGDSQPPALDLVLLGMGADGHTASLFPDSPALSEEQRLVVAVRAHRPEFGRVTLTPPVLNRAREVLFLVGGREKAMTLKQVLGGPFRPHRFPAQIVRPPNGRVTWLVDREAAGELDGFEQHAVAPRPQDRD